MAINQHWLCVWAPGVWLVRTDAKENKKYYLNIYILVTCQNGNSLDVLRYIKYMIRISFTCFFLLSLIWPLESLKFFFFFLSLNFNDQNCLPVGHCAASQILESN